MNSPRNSSPAFSLIEVTLALGIAAFCLLTVFGLLPLGLNSTQNAAEQTTVAGIATAISADLHGTPSISSTGATTTQFGFVISGTNSGVSPTQPRTQTLFFGQDGSPVTGVGDDATAQRPSGASTEPARYRATIRISPDPTLFKITSSTTLYKVWILITWPALADPTALNTPQYFSGSFETVTSLNLSTH